MLVRCARIEWEIFMIVMNVFHVCFAWELRAVNHSRCLRISIPKMKFVYAVDACFGGKMIYGIRLTPAKTHGNTLKWFWLDISFVFLSFHRNTFHLIFSFYFCLFFNRFYFHFYFLTVKKAYTHSLFICFRLSKSLSHIIANKFVISKVNFWFYFHFLFRPLFFFDFFHFTYSFDFIKSFRWF